MKLVNKTLLFALCALVLFAGCEPLGDASFDGTSVDSVTPEPIEEGGLVNTKWTANYGSITYTLEFTTGDGVTYSIGSNSNDYTYDVDESTVTIYDDCGYEFMRLISLSDQLVAVITTFTPADSSVLGNTINLVGTTWTGSYNNYAMTLKFASDAVFISGDDVDDTSGTYNVNGATVTITINGMETEFFYVSGQLIAGVMFTKST